MTTPPAPLTPVELTGEGLLLRPWPALGTRQDLADLRVGLSDPEQPRWNPVGYLEPPTDEQLVAFLARFAAGWADGTAASWAVREPASGRLLGHLALREVSVRLGNAKVGYWTMPQARGQGVATRALRVAGRWAFGELGLHRMELHHAVGHAASCRIAERCGYRLEGTLREAMPNTFGQRQDVHLHARLATDPEV